MSRADAQYNTLLQQYNIAVQRYKDLKEQFATKKEQWQEREDKFNITLKIVRELCDSIICKSSEMNQLGKGDSWDDLPINDIIRLAQKVLKEYDAERTDLMLQVHDVAEERRNRIAELEELVEFYKNSHNNITPISSGTDDSSDTSYDNTTEQDESSEEDNTSEKTDPMSGLNNLFAGSGNSNNKPSDNDMNNLFAGSKKKADASKLSPAMQNKVEQGKVTLEMVNEVKEGIKNGTATIFFEDEDEKVVEGDKTAKLHKENIKNNITAKPNKKSLKVYHSPKANYQKKMLKDQIEEEVYSEDIKAMVNKISKENWLVIKAIGDTGYSLIKDITGPCVDIFMHNGLTLNARTLSSKIRDLTIIGVLEKEKFSSPLSGSTTAFKLTEQGMFLYKKKYGKKPVESEASRIISEHTTLSHGYGIIQCAELIRSIKIENKNIFTEVNEWNRNNPIKVGDADSNSNIYYIPDIVCKDKNGAITYIEYELNHHTVSDFNAKNNKMLRLGINRINYIVPNMETAKALCERLVNWVKSKGSSETIRHTVIRVTTAKALEGQDLRRDGDWMFTLHPVKEQDFTKNF